MIPSSDMLWVMAGVSPSFLQHCLSICTSSFTSTDTFPPFAQQNYSMGTPSKCSSGRRNGQAPNIGTQTQSTSSSTMILRLSKNPWTRIGKMMMMMMKRVYMASQLTLGVTRISIPVLSQLVRTFPHTPPIKLNTPISLNRKQLQNPAAPTSHPLS